MTTPPSPSFSDSPRRVCLTAHGPTATVRIDDADVTRNVRAYALEHHAGQPPQLILYATEATTTEFDGYAHVALADQVSTLQTITDFLAAVDPLALDEAALNRDDYGDGRGATARAMLATLTEWALQAGGA